MADGSHVINGVVSTALAILFGWYAFHGLIMRINTSKWNKTRGIMVSQADYKLFGFIYNCDVKYKYKVNGKVYFGTRTDNWESGTNPTLCKELSRYADDHKFPLYYDPFNPQESVIDNALDPFYYSFLIAVSVYDSFEAFIYFYLSGIVPFWTIMLPIFLYSVVSILSVVWVGLSNIYEYFSSSLLAICGGLYFSAIIVKGLHSGYNLRGRIEQRPVINIV